MNTNNQEDAFYTIEKNRDMFLTYFIAPGYDRAQSLHGFWAYCYNTLDQKEIEKELTEKSGYHSATYLDNQTFNQRVREQHKQIWLSIYKGLRDQITDAQAQSRERIMYSATDDLQKVKEKLFLYHAITPEQADQLIAEQEEAKSLSLEKNETLP